VQLGTLIRDFGDIDAEAAACRDDAALFDFSFMSRGASAGPSARDAMQSLTRRSLVDLQPGRIAYGIRTDAQGRARADLTFWRMPEERWEMFSGRHEDVAAIPGGSDLSDASCILSLQGPRSLQVLAALAEVEVVARLGYFAHAEIEIAGIPCRLGRLGYTGERGFELVAPAAARQTLWDALAKRARPAGFAAIDILRIEAGFIFFLNEFKPMVTPGEAGLKRFGGPLQRAPRVELIGFAAESETRPVLFAPTHPVQWPPAAGEIVVTSAAWSERAGATIGLGYVRAGEASTRLVDPAGAFRDVRRTAIPFVDPLKRRVRGTWNPADLLPAA
jgi:aminomethyltransferase